VVERVLSQVGSAGRIVESALLVISQSVKNSVSLHEAASSCMALPLSRLVSRHSTIVLIPLSMRKYIVILPLSSIRLNEPPVPKWVGRISNSLGKVIFEINFLIKLIT